MVNKEKKGEFSLADVIRLVGLMHKASMTKVTFTRYDRMNFRQAKKFDLLLGSYGTVRYFRSVYAELRAISARP